ncbi:superfamily II DNA/RNA helicase [Aspergillus flavus]|uniref:Superfamily II DNA/RNA helicase n=3 Tax=Aspergillus subgen. Circumdati TaxID=2720871 RepID=A0A7U2MRU4_ASPFN|nr:superfamily II DNA/RNA helicase [Aspergillus oryzae 3.042]KAB8245133.1 SNF2 family N-terminal domain-containing protein [Aspergillus flavus]KDE77471.1 superfamily II DNA/RNA helicase [Aspergillus oryzae 100-8]QRD88772.1 superfamily II DNA/RNA helicase [Aspergillus flavus]RMZ47838.1 chromatin structure-remodeling complex subunit snf2 [Aspergillus flavus]|eukprot:EIT72547.1 superfamily II DNA/RNA helicase [Aspergillus oryzae 3.042]
MASLQSAPNMATGNMSLPPNLTQQHIQEVFQKYKQMQEQGVRHDDPEFLKAQHLLSAVQRQQFFQKQRQVAQQQLQAQQRQQMNGAGPDSAATNGLNRRTNSVSSGTGAIQDGTSTQAGSQQQALGQSASQKGAPVASGSFSAEQLATLRNQIVAFKWLSKNLSIPPRVQEQLFASKKQQTPAPSDSVTAAENILESVSQNKTEQPAITTETSPQSKDFYETFQSPYDSVPKTISFSDHASRAYRTRIPALMPPGIDLEQVREERELVLYNKINARKAELAELPANIGVWDTSRSDTATGDDSLKLKALIEYKMLNLLPKQRMFRKQIQNEMFHFDNLGMTANRSNHRRMKKQSLREARITEKLEKQQRDARETREKRKQYDQLQAILNHGAELQNAANQQRTRMQKLGRMMLQHHQHMEREEQKRVERTAKQRLQALKANDEETYLKLLGQAKDSRISHLLKQTDNFLKQLAASVREQQRSLAERYGEDDQFYDEEEEEEEDVGSGTDDETGGRRKIDYYAVAHRIKEAVLEQPTILVGGTLKEYQMKGLQWMISLYNNNLNGILADEMGLGKTIQTISLITYIIEKKKNNGPFLVIVPLSTLTNWNLEFEKWAPSVARVVYKGPPNARKQQQQQIRWGNFQVLLTTYEYIIKDRPILSKVKWNHMIVDEGHRMKNTQSKLSSTLSQYYTSRYRLILTGTPLQNNLPELWALLNFVLPNIFKSVKSFDEWFNTPFANTGGQDRMELSEEEQLLVIRRLHKVLRPFLLRRLKKDVEKDLPDKQERVIKCRFSALQAKLYKQLVTHNKMAVSDGKGGKTGMRGLSNMLMQLRKLCNHPFVFEPVEDQMNPGRGTNDLLWRTSGKFELLDRILPKFRATGHRVLMFFQMTQIMNIMEDFLRLRGMKYLRLDGSTKSDDRSDLLKLFNAENSEYFCFLLSTRAGGLGLNLQSADTVIIFDSDWNPHQDLQAQDRAHRIGQKNEVRILRLISSNSVEEKILERAQFKLDMDGKVIQAGKFDNKSTNEEREALLRTLLETAEAADQINEQEEMDDDDLNDIMARSDEELLVFQRLDKERPTRDPYGPGHPLPRLMCEEELPDIYVSEENPVTEEVEVEMAGRGARERKVTRYDDGLTEEQWLMAVDADDDTIEDAIARKEARVERRRVNKERRQRKVVGDSSPEPSRESSETPQPKKRGRRGPAPKRKAEELVEETPQPKRKRGRQAKPVETLSPEDRAILQRILNSTYQALMDMEQELPADSSDSEDGPVTRSIIEPFMKPPPKSQYPDYYMIIQSPIAMEMIRKKINRDEYQNLKDFRNDIHLLCQNARTYNEDGSILFQDANDIEAKCLSELKRETEGYPQFANYDDQGAPVGQDQSLAATPSVETPSTVTTPGQPKLKLTFNSGNRDSTGAANGTPQTGITEE